MEEAAEKTLLTAALINSETLETELILPQRLPGTIQYSYLNICSVSSLMNHRLRSEFVFALNHKMPFECVTVYNNRRLSISLCPTFVFGERWSHLLLIGCAQSNTLLA